MLSSNPRSKVTMAALMMLFGLAVAKENLHDGKHDHVGNHDHDGNGSESHEQCGLDKPGTGKIDPDLLAKPILMEAAQTEVEASPVHCTIPPGKIEYIEYMKAKNAETLEHGKKHPCMSQHPIFKASISRLTKKFEQKVQQFRMMKNQLQAGVEYNAPENKGFIDAFQSMCRAKMAVDNYDPKRIRLDDGKMLDGREVPFDKLEEMYSGNSQKIPLRRWNGCKFYDDSEPDQPDIVKGRNSGISPDVAASGDKPIGEGFVTRTITCPDCKEKWITRGNPYRNNGRLPCGCEGSSRVNPTPRADLPFRPTGLLNSEEPTVCGGTQHTFTCDECKTEFKTAGNPCIGNSKRILCWDCIHAQATAEEGNFFQRWGNAFYNLMF